MLVVYYCCCLWSREQVIMNVFIFDIAACTYVYFDSFEYYIKTRRSPKSHIVAPAELYGMNECNVMAFPRMMITPRVLLHPYPWCWWWRAALRLALPCCSTGGFLQIPPTTSCRLSAPASGKNHSFHSHKEDNNM